MKKFRQLVHIHVHPEMHMLARMDAVQSRETLYDVYTKALEYYFKNERPEIFALQEQRDAMFNKEIKKLRFGDDGWSEEDPETI